MGSDPSGPGWTIHPYEIALGGAPGPVRTTLGDRLAGHLGLDVARIRHRPENPILGRLEALDRDAALIEAPGLPSVPTIVVLDGVSSPEVSIETPVAAVGPGNRPPKLPWEVPYFSLDDIPGIAAFVRSRWDAQTAQRPVYGLVLTGGRSTRMGVDKAALAYHDQEESRRVFDLLEPFCARVFVSCRADQADLPGRKGLPQIHDGLLDKGPLSGILSAFEAHPQATWLVVACDLPRVDRAVLEALIAGRDPFKVATVFRGYQAFPEPLCALYEPKARSRLWQFLAAGADCPRKMMINSRVQVLDPLAGDRLANVNRPDEREEVLRDFRR